MLDLKTIKKILSFVHNKPRSVDEIARHLNKNWRTADRYVDKIGTETGEIKVRIFRKGTRGALKVVYWNNLEQVNSTSIQERLFKFIDRGRNKEDFSPFDIYQHVNPEKSEAIIEYESKNVEQQNIILLQKLHKAKKQLLCFSGNLSWTNISIDGQNILSIIEELAQGGVEIKVLCRVNFISGIDNIRNLLQINDRLGKDMVKIRHCEHPLRGFIVDNKMATLKEIKDPCASDGFKDRAFVHYYFYDREYAEWLAKVFWCLFKSSPYACDRINALNRMKYGASIESESAT